MKTNEGGKLRLWLSVAALALGILLVLASGSFSADKPSDASSLEQKLARLCERVDGVGSVSVAVSLNGDSIEGVGVVCVGGNDPAIRRELTRLIAAACGIRSNKIFVTGGIES